MMDWKRGYSPFSVFAWACILLLMLSASVLAQGLPQSRFSAPSVVRGGLDLAPSNPLNAPVGMGDPGMDSILLTPQLLQGLLPMIPNFQVGYLYSTGKSVQSGRVTLDFLLPLRFDKDTAAFGEVHNEWQDFWKTVTRGADNRVDLSVGGGFRKIFGDSTLIGVNGFYDGTRLGGTWYNSGSVGLEYAALLPGNDALDLSFNWYGNLFNSDVLANAFRRGPENYDFQAGYSHELWDGGPDFRLYASGYRFSAGSGVYGFRGGAELKSRDGMFVLKYEAAHDRINQTYHTVGGFLNVGLEFQRLLSGASPFVMPEPLFRSPRNLRRWLTRTVNRMAGQPISIIVSRTTVQGLGGPTPLFTRTAVVGVVNGGSSNEVPLSAEITAADLLGVTRVVMTWDGGATPGGTSVVQLARTPICVSAGQTIAGAVSPPGLEITNAAFWNFQCGPWDTLIVGNSPGSQPARDFGTVTLSFFGS